MAYPPDARVIFAGFAEIILPRQFRAQANDGYPF